MPDQMLRSDGERYRQLIDSVKDYAIVMLDPDGRIISWNTGARQLQGFEETEILGQPIERLFSPDAVAAGVPARLLAVAAAEGRCEDEDWRIRKDGTRFFANVILTAMHDPTGQLLGFAKVTSDVSARRQAQDKLHASEEQFKRAQRLAEIGSAWWDIRTRTVEWSDETYRIYGVSREAFDPSLQGILEFIHADDRDKLLAGRENTLNGICPEPLEYRIVRRDGAVRRLYREFAPITNDAGSLIGFIGSVQDITERRQTEDQLRQAQKMEAIGNLTGGMAHDFNNLLGIIIANIEFLREIKGDDADVAELTQEALDAALRGAELTRRLLAFARQQPLQPRRIDVNELVLGITRLIRRTLGENIEIALELATETWRTVIDPAQLEASVLNLANNSRDAMPTGGQLTIRTANRYLDADYASMHNDVVPGDYVLIEVSDAGIGMTPEVMSQIFEPFFTTKEQGRGTGLGLSMVFGFIKQSGGHITVYSEPGLGTTFRLYLPRMSEEAALDGESIPEPPITGGSETILVVEDNEALRRIAVRQLTGMGYRVIEAGDAADALATMEQENIDLLLTDIVMPGGVDGIQLAEETHQRWPSVKILFASGFAAPQANGIAWSLPKNGRLLTKPYRRNELAEAVRSALDN
ncbi:MAG TPA: PAS domain S-box protein [Stellaceae bacterium]|jgi:PAS domain S-box-containing protein|nr:PAS domain S-box protein [Stellaceae bacterium]